MVRYKKLVALGEFIATIGICLFITSETPELSYVGGLGSEPLALFVFASGVMARGLFQALYAKPDRMSERHIAYSWVVPYLASLVIAVQFTSAGYLTVIQAMGVVIGISAAFSLSVGSIEDREDYSG